MADPCLLANLNHQFLLVCSTPLLKIKIPILYPLEGVMSMSGTKWSCLASLAGLALGLVFSAGGFCSAAEAVPAFPGAEGFGATTPGGRGGKVYLVTTLADYIPGEEKPIPGSLRAACMAEGPRIVVFRVSGTISLKAPLRITEPFLTLAGQSAPGGGICVKDRGTVIVAHDVIIRHMRFRTGDEWAARYTRQLRKSTSPDARMADELVPDCLTIGWGGEDPRSKNARNIIFDHCSASWGIDEVLSVSGAGIDNVTVQWCLVSESLHDSYHFKGKHGCGSLIKCNGNVTFHHNLYAHHTLRSPCASTYGKGSMLLDFRNNVIYNSYGYSEFIPVRFNYVGNYIKRPTQACVFRLGGESPRMYVEGNHLEGAGPRNEDNWNLIGNAKPQNKAKRAFPVAAVTAHTAPEAYQRVLASCGATLPLRDAVDNRIVREVKAGTGRIINSQNEVGGWPELKSDLPPKDTDRDGMPDDWEEKYGFNPQDRSDNSQDEDGDGYTNIEECINATDPLVVERT